MRSICECQTLAQENFNMLDLNIMKLEFRNNFKVQQSTIPFKLTIQLVHETKKDLS